MSNQRRPNDIAPGKVSATDLWLRRGWPIWLISVSVLIADQVTKQVVINWLRYGESWPAEGFLRFTHARNTGAAFSLFEGQSTILSIVALVAVGLILWLYKTSGGTSLLLRLALALQLGGAFGNLLDRFRYGYVVDFFDVGPWPIFNVADSAISVGIVVLIVYVVFGNRLEDSPDEPTVDESTVVVAQCQHCERRRVHVESKSHASIDDSASERVLAEHGRGTIEPDIESRVNPLTDRAVRAFER